MNRAELYRLALIGVFLALLTFINAQKVPQLESAVKSLEVQHASESAKLADVQSTVDRIEDKLDRLLLRR
jgi:hypothetical protein